MTVVAPPSPLVDEDRLEALLAELSALPAGSPDRLPLRRRAIELALPLADRLAARYYNCGEPDDDLRQVAAMGVVRAVDGYRPGAGRGFIPYAVPTVLGTLRRHFRDHTWSVRPPRKVLELRQRMAVAEDQLAQNLLRRPTPAELADRLHLDPAEVADLQQAAWSCRPASLEALGASGQPHPGVRDAFDTTEDLLVLGAALPHLPERLRQVVRLRFWEEKTQREIAALVGVSQVHVSRLLLRALTILRDYVTPAEPDPRRHRRMRGHGNEEPGLRFRGSPALTRRPGLDTVRDGEEATVRTTTERDLNTGVTTVRVTGELLRATLATARSAIGKAAAECPTAVLVDLSEVDAASPSHLSVFVTATYEAQSHWGVPVLLYGAKPEVDRQLSAFRNFVALYDDEWQARTALRAYVPRWMRQRLGPEPANAAVARALAGEACLIWGLRGLQNAARLIASELAANAIRHAGTDLDVMIAYTGRYLRIAVRDGSSTLPRAAGSPHAGGNRAPASVRGLCAVEAFSTHWGATRIPGGKIVWALISTERREN